MSVKGDAHRERVALPKTHLAILVADGDKAAA
jgi:hypothetical protein